MPDSFEVISFLVKPRFTGDTGQLRNIFNTVLYLIFLQPSIMRSNCHFSLAKKSVQKDNYEEVC